MPFGFMRISVVKDMFEALRAENAALRGDVRLILQQQVKIMTALDDIKAGLDKVDSAIAAAETKIDADAQTIKDDVAKLAAFAAAPQGTPDADLQPLVSRINAMADGLTKHLEPVADAVPAPPAAPAAPAA